MMVLRQIFWDEKASRFRAGWRLAIQLGFFIAILAGLGLLTRSLDKYAPQDPLDSDVSVLFSTTIGLSLVLSVLLAGRFIDRRRWRDFGFRFSRDWWIDLGFGLALGGLLQAAIFALETASGWVTVLGRAEGSWGGFGFPLTMVAFLLFFVWVGVYEETWTRGYLVKNLAEGLSLGPLGPSGAVWLAAIGTTIAFGLGHMTNPGATAFSLLAFMPAGLLYAIAYIMTGELAIPIGYHIAWNFFEGAVFGFPVSGYPLGASLIVTQTAGPDLWTGGPFGPEGGILGIMARLAGILLVLVWVWVRYRTIAPRQALTVPDLLSDK
jgi:membrane protease YdiL (CAAX protease family)